MKDNCPEFTGTGIEARELAVMFYRLFKINMPVEKISSCCVYLKKRKLVEKLLYRSWKISDAGLEFKTENHLKAAMNKHDFQKKISKTKK